jgi:hypothetical protein
MVNIMVKSGDNGGHETVSMANTFVSVRFFNVLVCKDKRAVKDYTCNIYIFS